MHLYPSGLALPFHEIHERRQVVDTGLQHLDIYTYLVRQYKEDL
jgi:hypothetical protein